MKSASILALGAALLAAPAMAKEGAQGLSQADKQFVQESAMGNTAEVHLGALAVAQGTTPAIREFGRWMISTHSFANRELTTIVERVHGETPAPKLSPKTEDLMGKLQNLQGPAFDKAYLEAMKEDHEDGAKKVTAEVRDGKDYLVKTFAANLEPAIKEHLAQVEVLMTEMNSKDAGAAEKKADMKAEVGGLTGTPKGNTDQAKTIQEHP